MQSLHWAADCPMLAAVQDGRLTVWYLPSIIFLDRSLLAATTQERDSSEFGKHPTITAFLSNR